MDLFLFYFSSIIYFSNLSIFSLILDVMVYLNSDILDNKEAHDHSHMIHHIM